MGLAGCSNGCRILAGPDDLKEPMRPETTAPDKAF